jgi:murein DD-endopeptidase MepM/ murein hydrolase activator NlpD
MTAHMQNKILILLGIFLMANTACAMPVIENKVVPQGETLEIIVPEFDIKNVSASFEDKQINFYKITEEIDQLTPITRAEFLQQIYLNSGEPGSDSKPFFEDVPAESRFYSAIQYAAENGIVHGYEDGLFHPFNKITRGQAAKIIMNTYEPEQILEDIPVFPDIPENYSLKDYMYAAVGAEIFKGYPDGFMRPDRSINFLEADLIIQRASNLEETIKILERPAFRAFMGIHRLSAAGDKTINFEFTNLDDSMSSQEKIISVTAQNFKTEWFNLAQDKTELLGSDYQDNTWELIDAAKAETSPDQLWENKFIVPTEGEITLGFGDKLYINGVYSGSHFGIDYANAEGTPVYASNNGIVKMAAETPTYGNTIIIDHGQNIFTMYLHLSEMEVSPEDSVNKGDLIGLMGSTGVATGPHLHFTHFVGDIIVSSEPWYEGRY